MTEHRLAKYDAEEYDAMYFMNDYEVATCGTDWNILKELMSDAFTIYHRYYAEGDGPEEQLAWCQTSIDRQFNGESSNLISIYLLEDKKIIKELEKIELSSDYDYDDERYYIVFKLESMSNASAAKKLIKDWTLI